MGIIANRTLLECVDNIRRKRIDINAGIMEYKSTPNALLLDVREKDEYASGHIPATRGLWKLSSGWVMMRGVLVGS